MVTEARETGTLIGSDKVAGTYVYGPDDQTIGTIERVMIEKTSGRVSYAVLGFGGFLGIDNDHYPLPWNSLKYDTEVGGYRMGVTADRLDRSRSYTLCSAMVKGWQRGEHRFVVRGEAMDSCAPTETTRDLHGNCPTDPMLV